MFVRTGLTHWPLVGIGDGGAIHDINSSSLARFQAYSAVAYVSRRALFRCCGVAPLTLLLAGGERNHVV